MTATAPYRITPVIRTVDELCEEKKKLEKEHGSLEDLYLRNERYGLTRDEHNAMMRLRDIRFLLGEG